MERLTKDVHSETAPAREYSVEELKYLYRSLPMTENFRQVREQIAKVMAGLENSTAGEKEIHTAIDGAYKHWQAETRKQDWKYRLFIEREREAKSKKSN